MCASAAEPRPTRSGDVLRTVTAVSVIALLMPFAADGATRSQLVKREHRQHLSLHRWNGTIRFFANHPRQARTVIGRRELHRARIWVRIIRRELGETHAQMRPRNPWTAEWFQQALCIHSREGAWNANTGNGYFGGMQFMAATYRSVGGRSDGRADLDSPREQLHRAWLVWKRDGMSWREWGTAGKCGLA